MSHSRRAPLARRLPALPSGPKGQSLLEYLVVLVLVGISLTAGPSSPIEQCFRAFAAHHARLTDAVSRP